MSYFNLEEIDLLKEYERYFYTVIYLKYKSGTKHDFNVRLQEIYENHTGVQEKVNWSCPSCSFSYYKKVGELYYDSIAQNKKENETVEDVPEPILKINNLDQTVTNKETNDGGKKYRIRKSDEKTQKKRGRKAKQ